MARPRTGSPQSLLTKANATFEKLLNDPKTPPEIAARLSTKIIEWGREDARAASQQVRLSAARERELRAEGVAEYLSALSQQVNAAIADVEMAAPAHTAPSHEHPLHFE